LIMSLEFEIIFWIVFVIVVYFWFSNRLRRAVEQIQKEEFYREVIRRTEQKRKIDELYGRDREDR